MHDARRVRARKNRRNEASQIAFRFSSWGGKRRGAGRKSRSPRSNHDHLRHEPIAREHAAHVTMRLQDGLPSLRETALFAVVLAVLTESAFGLYFRIVEFSVLRNHLHLLIEAADSIARSSGMKALTGRLSSAINLHLGRPGGAVLGDRYDLHVLETPREARNALLYVLNNAKKHAREQGVPLAPDWIDPRSSAPWFTGWRDRKPATRAKPVATARTWLLREGWKRRGLLSVREVPGPSSARNAQSHDIESAERRS